MAFYVRPVKVALAIIGAAVIAACGGDRQSDQAASLRRTAQPPIITGSGLGPVRIGLPRDSLAAVGRVLRDRSERDNEGNPQEVVYLEVGRDTVTIEVSDHRVWRIRITSGGLATREGIRVGTPLARVRTTGAVIGAAGEGKVYLLDPTRCGVSLGLSPEAMALQGTLDSAALARLPSSTQVDEILVVGCERAAS